jgi:hypothetical protein
MATFASVTSLQAAVSVPWSSIHRVGSITIPAGLPKGLRYYVLVYDVEAASAADADVPVSVFRVFKDDNGALFFENEITLPWKH